MNSALIAVGLSGGVDSSVSAHLLQQAGHSIVGVFMKNWEEDDQATGTCPAEQDAIDAAAAAELLGIGFHTRNFAAEYWDGVFEHFLEEHRRGRTPNPDILCNREIKFRTFLEHAEDLGADRIATGHYARVDSRDGRWRLLRGRDHNKDQSYFLYTLGQPQLARTLFPVGELEKPEVRAIAARRGLANAAKKDSTGICFIGERNFQAFLKRFLPAQPGPMRTPEGLEVGEHQGLMYYTLGQRQGLGIGGRRDASGEPWFVIGKRMEDNTLIVAQGNDTHWLQCRRIRASEASWTAGVSPARTLRCTARIRYRQVDQPCEFSVDQDGGIEIRFDLPQRAATPGQSIVFYADEECLGGAVIDASDAEFGGLARDG